MKYFRSPVVCLAVVMLAWGLPGYGQNVTTGAITGVIRDAQGGVLPGATVVATHTPTGTVYETVTGPDGTFNLLNVRVGGPYGFMASLSGFRQEERSDLQVSLGQATSIDLTLQLQTLTETVLVTADASALFSPTTMGTAANIDREALETLPTVSRSLQDFARTNPFFVQSAVNANPAGLSVAGRSPRYNNLQIDGAVNNDVFAIGEQGIPGSFTNTEPISLDAIQELQLVISPYDVRQGSFSGGGINAITRSGTNEFHGTAFYLFRNESLVGDGINDRPIATFDDKQFGASLGGPIAANRVFFFGNYELGRRSQPAGWSIAGSGQQFGREADTARVLAIARDRYGYDPGSTAEFIRGNDNDKVFARGDVNLGSHQLTIRHNFIDAFNDVGTPSGTRFIFPDQFYRFHSRQNSTVGQLNSRFGTSYNEFRVTFQRIRERRANETSFPQVNVRLGGNQDLRFGTEQFSGANELDQDIIEINDDFTIVRGGHQITIGTHNELFDFRNLFIRDVFGAYDFASIEAFEQGVALTYNLSYSATSNPRQPAEFAAYQLGFYAGDLWRIAPRLSITYGLRVDKPIFPDTPSANPMIAQLYGLRTDVVPETQTWSPRAGFNYDLGSDSVQQQVRGGFGLFGGRTPYVWLSNQYTSTGNEFVRLGANNVQFSPDPNQQPRSLGTASRNEINLIDPDYDFPQTLRGNLGYDRSIGWQRLVLGAELLFSNTVKDIDYQNFNLVQVATLPDGRPRFGLLNPAFGDVVFLTNTAAGSSWSTAFKAERPFQNGWFANASYLYGRTKAVNDGGSSQARSNWVNQQNQGNPNDVPLGISNFDPGHRISLSGAYTFDFQRARLTLSAYYNGQSGRPYSYVYSSGDPNQDGIGLPANNNNDLLYIPASPDDVIVRNGPYEQLTAFLDAGHCNLTSGEIMDRNTCRAPWTNTLDVRAAVDVPIGGVDAELTMDMLNLLNLFNSEWGQVEYALFNGLTPVAYGGLDPATGRMIYNLNAVTRSDSQRYQRDDLRSRWQGQIGLRLRF
jgi:hypothetical protein